MNAAGEGVLDRDYPVVHQAAVNGPENIGKRRMWEIFKAGFGEKKASGQFAEGPLFPLECYFDCIHYVMYSIISNYTVKNVKSQYKNDKSIQEKHG
jgi:hypothetical protein